MTGETKEKDRRKWGYGRLTMKSIGKQLQLQSEGSRGSENTLFPHGYAYKVAVPFAGCSSSIPMPVPSPEHTDSLTSQ